METKINVLSDTEHEIEVILDYSEIKNEIDEAYKKESKSISMPGFRKGKVPFGMLKKIYGEAIEYKASEDIANKKFWDIVTEKDLKPLSMPQMTDLNLELNKSLKFKVKYEVKPTLDVKDYKGLEIEKPIFKVKDEDIEAEVQNLLKSKATFVPADQISDKNFRITVDLQRIDKDGKEIEGSKSENMVIDLSDSKVNEQIINNSMGKKESEQFEFTFVDEHMHGEEKHVEEYRYLATIKKIEKMELPEVTEELVEQLSNKRAKTLQELKDLTKKNYQDYYLDQSDKIYHNSLLDKIVKNNDFEPSKSYTEIILKRLLEVEKQNAKQYRIPNFNEELVKENLRPRAEWNAKWQIIMENIAEKENLRVEDSELETLANEESKKNSISAEKLLKYYKDSNIADSMLEEKVLKFLEQNNIIKEVDPDVKHQH